MSFRESRLVRSGSAFLAFVAMSAVAGVLVAAAVTPAVAVTGAVADKSITAFDSLPSYLRIAPLDQRSTMYATRDGAQVPLATFYSQDRTDVGWGDIAQYVKDAAVSTEDPRFYSEGGVDITGTMRGVLSTYLAHGGTQGGSSITQQYVKNVLVQKCELLDVRLDDAAREAAQMKRYHACYRKATADTPARKLREMRLAIGVAKKYSKTTVLQGYLNITGFGGSVYGIQAAAQYYFNTTAAALTLPQAATLVAILNNPNYLRIDGGSVKPSTSSVDNTAANGFKAALARRNYVLKRMEVAHTITPDQRIEAEKMPIQPAITPVPSGCMTANAVHAGSFCDYVERVILTDPAFGKTADDRAALFERGGLSIHTTLNLDLQDAAQTAVSRYVPSSMPGTDIGGTNVAEEVGTGRIVTMVQNKQFDDTADPGPDATSVNYNTDEAYGGSQGFQTGSAYKIFDLIEWLNEGHSLGDVVDGSQHHYLQSDFHESAPCSDIGGSAWNVTNDEGASAGKISVMAATAESVNTAFAMMATNLDLCDIKSDATDLLVHAADEHSNPLIANPSSILGTNYIAPLTMATAYAGVANGGVACSPIAIDSITDANGKPIAVPKSTCSSTPVSPGVAAAVIDGLKGVITNGTGTIANPHDGVPIFGKTGTTDGSYDNWFVSSTTKVAQATWVGNLQSVQRANGTWSKTEIRSLTLGGYWGGDAKLHIAHDVIRALDSAYGGGSFPSPPDSMI